LGFPLAISLYCAIGLAFTVLIGVRWRASVWQTAPARGVGASS
jgi:hypothetical protein